MIKRVKLETIYKMAKEDNEKIKERKLFPDGWDEKVYDYYNKLSKESSDVRIQEKHVYHAVHNECNRYDSICGWRI